MPGMTTGLNLDDPAVVGAFRAALLHQGLVMLLVFAVVGAVWGSGGGRGPGVALRIRPLPPPSRPGGRSC
jgi:hypothetical protein